MNVKKKALKRVRELLNRKDITFDNLSVGINADNCYEINKIIDFDNDKMELLYRNDEKSKVFTELSNLIHLVWQIELNERDIEKILSKTSK